MENKEKIELGRQLFLSDKQNLSFEELSACMAFMGFCYKEGNKAYQTDSKAREEIDLINKKIYKSME